MTDFIDLVTSFFICVGGYTIIWALFKIFGRKKENEDGTGDN